MGRGTTTQRSRRGARLAAGAPPRRCAGCGCCDAAWRHGSRRRPPPAAPAGGSGCCAACSPAAPRAPRASCRAPSSTSLAAAGCRGPPDRWLPRQGARALRCSPGVPSAPRRPLPRPARAGCRCIGLQALARRRRAAQGPAAAAAARPAPCTTQARAAAAAHLFFMSTSPFLQARLLKRREIPLMAVMAYMIFCLPSTLVFSTRRMCWNASPAMRDCAHADTGVSHRRGRARPAARRARSGAHPHLDVAVCKVAAQGKRAGSALQGD